MKSAVKCPSGEKYRLDDSEGIHQQFEPSDKTEGAAGQRPVLGTPGLANTRVDPDGSADWSQGHECFGTENARRSQPCIHVHRAGEALRTP